MGDVPRPEPARMLRASSGSAAHGMPRGPYLSSERQTDFSSRRGAQHYAYQGHGNRVSADFQTRSAVADGRRQQKDRRPEVVVSQSFGDIPLFAAQRVGGTPV